jgi:hypothetical protein
MATGIKKTHEEFVNEVFDKFGDIYEFISQYKTQNNEINVKHIECDYTFTTTPKILLKGNKNKGYVCPKCNGVIRYNTESFKNRVYELVGNEYIVIGEYSNNHTNIKMKHNIFSCNHTYYVKPKDFINKHSRCPECFGTKRRTNAEFKKEIYSLVGNDFTVLGEYINNSTPVLMMHNINNCNHQFEVSYSDFKNLTNKCPKCYMNSIITRENYQEKFFKKYGNEYIVLGDYINHKSSVLIKHNTEDCGKVFYKNLYSFYRNNSECPCNSSFSKGEDAILQFVHRNEIFHKKSFTFDNCRNINPLPFDFAVLNSNGDLSMIIEYDGEQHFYPVDFAGKGLAWAEERFSETKKHDSIKNTYCKDNNIPLYRIPYWKFNEIDIILNKLIHNEHVEIDENFIVQ